MKTVHTYKNILNPGFKIEAIPPVTSASIIITLINLKNPDLLVIRVVTEENIIKIKVKK